MTPEPRHPETPRAGRGRVAVVDDEADVLTFVRFLLEDQGYEVLTSEGPAGVVALLEEFEPDLICLDLLMPEQMGFSLFVRLRRHDTLGSVPIFILSGLNARAELAAALEAAGGIAPPSAWIEKPVDPQLFLAEVARAVSRRPGDRP